MSAHISVSQQRVVRVIVFVATIKIYEEEGLASFNDKYDTMTFTEYDNVTLIGRVLGILEPASVASKRDAERYETMHQDDEE